MKNIYFIPGLQEKNPTKYKTLDLSVDDVLNLPKIPKDSVLIGFSIGAKYIEINAPHKLNKAYLKIIDDLVTSNI